MRLWTLLLGALTLLGAVAPSPAAERTPRNVVLLIADDLGLQLGCYGDNKIRTPNLDGLAKNGVRFRHGFAAVSSCSPSRATLFTGQHTHTNGQYGLAHATHNFHSFDTMKSLPSYLKKTEYRTGILGKIHVQPRSVYPFDEEIVKVQGGYRSVAKMGEQARQFFRDSGDKPFVLVVGFTDPHRDFGNKQTYPGVQEVSYGPGDVNVPYFLSDKPDVRRDLAEYYQSISRLDKGVGFVLDALRETKHAEDTLVIFLSDNGPPFPGAKTTLYDPGIRLPLIISSPMQKQRGLTNNAMVSWIDVLPTILDWAGVPKPAALTGRSVLPILEEENPKGWDTIYASHQCHEVTMYYPMRVVRTRTHKYIRNLAHKLDYPFSSDIYGSPTWLGILERGDKTMGGRTVESFIHRPLEELYDLENDPNELKNVAADPKYAEVLKDLRERLKAWQTKTRDPWLVKYRYE
ncbi:MAG TPA: sulfatase [Gemmataceae bacterium]|jgi:N-sulfoglucosamine sulfohydrolase